MSDAKPESARERASEIVDAHIRIMHGDWRLLTSHTAITDAIAAALEEADKERDTLRAQLAKETERANACEEMERQASEHAESLKKQLAENDANLIKFADQVDASEQSCKREIARHEATRAQLAEKSAECERLQSTVEQVAKNRDFFCHYLNRIAKEFGTDKDNSAPEAVLRWVQELHHRAGESERFRLQFERERNLAIEQREAAEKQRDEALALVASYDRQDEVIGEEFEGVDEVTDVIRLLKQERDVAKAEVESFRQAMPTCPGVHELETKQAQLRKAVEALKPFAKAGMEYDNLKFSRSGNAIIGGVNDGQLTVGHCRKAAEVLKEIEV